MGLLLCQQTRMQNPDANICVSVRTDLDSLIFFSKVKESNFFFPGRGGAAMAVPPLISIIGQVLTFR